MSPCSSPSDLAANGASASSTPPLPLAKVRKLRKVTYIIIIDFSSPRDVFHLCHINILWVIESIIVCGSIIISGVQMHYRNNYKNNKL